jgi:hypothetical protein
MLDSDFRRMIARLAVAVMAADGRATPNEILALERLADRGLGPLRSLVGSEIERTARARSLTKVLRGAAALADAVRVTLGPKSKSVLLERRVEPWIDRRAARGCAARDRRRPTMIG